jgi:hypothetical protein
VKTVASLAFLSRSEKINSSAVELVESVFLEYVIVIKICIREMSTMSIAIVTTLNSMLGNWS